MRQGVDACLQAECTSAQTPALGGIGELHDTIPIRNAIDIPTVSVAPGQAEPPEIVVCFTEPCAPPGGAGGPSGDDYVVLAQAPRSAVPGPPAGSVTDPSPDIGDPAEDETASAATFVVKHLVAAIATAAAFIVLF